MTQADERQEQTQAELSTADLAGRSPVEQRPDLIEPTAPPPGEEGSEPLFPGDEAQQLRARWDAIQAGFVDEPRSAVEEADGLVATAMKRLAETFADERQTLESQWDRGDDVSTEDLRLALRRYRSFFGRLLSM